MLITVERYRAITGDTTTAASAVSARVEEAEELLADELGRALAYGTHTETLWPDHEGTLWPSVVPIESAGDYTVVGYGLTGVFGAATDSPTSVTYVGGWTVDTLPATIARDLAYAAQSLAPPDAGGIATQIPTGAISVRLGDVAITYGPDGAPGPAGARAVTWSRATLRWRHRTARRA